MSHTSEPPSGPAPTMEREVTPPPQEILDLTASCMDYVRQALRVDLDLTPETLPLLDHYLDTARADVDQRETLLPLLTRVAGAYFGEVVRHQYGGFWRLPSSNVVDWQLCLRQAFVWFNPIGVAADALHASDSHDGPSSQLKVAPEERRLIQERLALAPELPEDQYYQLSSRLEAIEIIVETLRARMEATGYADTEFSEEDYEAELGGLL